MKPWLETWDDEMSMGIIVDQDEDCAKLAMAAPEMCRALLAVEWGAKHIQGLAVACPGCGARRGLTFEIDYGKHDALCILDAVLTKAGLPDQKSRDAARKELGI